ncbi:MAG: Rrf2 family transcriptional regulator [Candidatus Magasanikbacteria bacterium]|nr:Rrf2 family transcriptional regulator [Candidatus Magasanikbacteria bacterium]
MLTMRKETDYAIHMLKYLAKQKAGFISLRELASDTDISFLFLQKIARKLRMSRLIKAGAGVSGGYSLNIPAKRISLKMIIETIEGNSAILPCLCVKNTSTCKGSNKKCILKAKLTKMNKKIGDILDKTKLTDL